MKRISNLGVKTVLVAVAILFALSVGKPALAESWDMATAYADSTFHTKNIRQFLDDVKEASGGALKVSLHNNATLFKAKEIKRAVQTGQVQIGEILLNGFGNENPILAVDAIPFLANDYESAMRLYKFQRPLLDEIFAKWGLRLLYAVPWPEQGFLSRTEMQSVAAFKGKKFRYAGPLLARLGEHMGAVPVNLPWGDVPQAFQTGTVDVFITSAMTSCDLKAWDFIKHFNKVGSMYVKNGVIVNASAFDALPSEVQSKVLSAAKVAEKRGWAMSAAVVEETTKTLKKHGVSVDEPTAAFVDELYGIGKKMTDEWVKDAGQVGAELIKKYKSE